MTRAEYEQYRRDKRTEARLRRHLYPLPAVREDLDHRACVLTPERAAVHAAWSEAFDRLNRWERSPILDRDDRNDRAVDELERRRRIAFLCAMSGRLLPVRAYVARLGRFEQPIPF